MKNKIMKKLMCVFFGIWIGCVLTQPAQAQFSVNINSDTSPTTFTMIQQMAAQLSAQTTTASATTGSKIAQALEYVQTAQRWVQTVEHYTTQIIGDIKRFTSLKGILTTVEKQLGLSDDTLKALADIGEIIRGAFTLKNSFLSLVRTRLSMIENLEHRARNGIFNPSADLQDLEEYLRYSIGREAGATLATREKLSQSDPLLERLTYELEKVRAERTAKQKELDGVNQQLGREGALSNRPRIAGVDDNGQSTTTFDGSRQSLSPEAVTALTIRAGDLEKQIADLIVQEQRLVNEIQERYEEMQKRYDSAYLKGRYWNSVLQGWNNFSEVQKRETENMIDGYGAPAPSDTPAQ